MEKIEEQLNNEIHVTKEEAQERYDFQIDGILSWHKNPKNKDRRSVEQVKKDTMNSCICEAAVAKAIDGKCNTQTFQGWDPSTFAWDVEAPDGTKIEVKWMSAGSDWYSFNEGLVTKLTKYVDEYDKVVVVTPTSTGDGYLVYPRFIFDGKNFDKYIKASKYDNYKPYYYNHHNPTCVQLNEGALCQ